MEGEGGKILIILNLFSMQGERVDCQSLWISIFLLATMNQQNGLGAGG